MVSTWGVMKGILVAGANPSVSHNPVTNEGGALTDNVAKNNNATGFEVSAGVISVTLTDNTARLIHSDQAIDSDGALGMAIIWSGRSEMASFW
jgi:hypothetical protein